jgi:murein DD-endopeptidase MepM/ murein hydrolase activator NlpD
MLVVTSALLAGLALAAPVPPPPPRRAAPGVPTENFTYGEGWGADRGERIHTGIDLGGKRGTPIYAIETA